MLQRGSTIPQERQGARRGALVFVLGLILLPVGIGLGLPHLAKTGLQPLSVVGLLALVAGLVLLGVGGTTLVRTRRGWRRYLLLFGLLALALLTATVLAPALALTNVPPTAVGSATPADRGLGHEDVEFATPDGVRLSGWYIPSRNRAAVALLHGAGSTRSAVLSHAEVLADAGYGVLLFDARGHGRSGGTAMDAGWYGDADVGGAISFLAGQPDVDPLRIGAVGLSMGGEEAIGAAASDARIRAVVAEGATNRVPGDLAWLSDVYGWRGAITEPAQWLLYNTADLLTSASQPITLRAAAATAGRPILLIAAGTVGDERSAAQFMQAGAPDSVRVWVAPDAGHVGALSAHPAEWRLQVTAFLEAALSPE
jgi:dienelactone hydrolase